MGSLRVARLMYRVTCCVSHVACRVLRSVILRLECRVACSAAQCWLLLIVLLINLVCCVCAACG